MRHGKASNDLYDAAIARKEAWIESGGLALGKVIWLRHFLIDYAMLVIFLIPLAMQAFPQSKAAQDLRVQNAMGLMQWLIILQFAVFLLTYVVDMRVCATAEENQDKNAS